MGKNDMPLPIKKAGKYTVLRTGKDVTLCSEAPKMRDALTLLLERNVHFICVDLTRAAIVDSSVLGTIVEFHTKLTRRGGEIAIMNAKSLVLEAFVRTQLNKVLRFVENESQL
jgi:anti-anti-sigma factor